MTADASEIRGFCDACDRPGPPDRARNFLCGECGDPSAVMVVCARCKNRVRFDADAGIARLAEYFPDQTDIARGSVLRIDCCASCVDILPARLRVRHYAVA